MQTVHEMNMILAVRALLVVVGRAYHPDEAIGKGRDGGESQPWQDTADERQEARRVLRDR